jgi:hypothetical protein
MISTIKNSGKGDYFKRFCWKAGMNRKITEDF